MLFDSFIVFYFLDLIGTNKYYLLITCYAIYCNLCSRDFFFQFHERRGRSFESLDVVYFLMALLIHLEGKTIQVGI